MKITKRQLRRIIKEEKSKILKEAYFNTVSYTDVDEGRPMNVSIKVGYDMVTVKFGSSMTIHLDATAAQELGTSLQEAGLELGDIEGGRNPGGSIG
jgi:hypothetical protein